MKWKRSRKSREQAAPNTPLTDRSVDARGQKPRSDSSSSSPEDEEEFEEEERGDKDDTGAFGAESLAPAGFGRNGTPNYGSYSEGEPQEGGAPARTAVLA